MDGGRIDYTLGFEADTAAIKAAADEMMRCNATWDQAPGAVNKLDDAEKKQGKTTLDLTKNKQDLKKALNLVATGNTEAGLAANFLMGRMAGLIGVGMYLIQQTKAGIASLMDSIATPVWEGFVGIVQKQRRAWQEAAQAAGLYEREIRRAEGAQDSRGEAAVRLQELVAARIKGEDAILEKRKANEIAWVNESVVRAEARESRIAEIERKYAEQKLARERQAAVQALALARLKTQLDSTELGGLENIRGELLKNRERLGTTAMLDAKEEANARRMAQEEEASARRQERITVLEAKYGIKPGGALPWYSYGDTAAAELTQLRTAEEAGVGIRAGLRQERAQMDRVNPGRRRAIAENDQALGWVEGDMRSLAGSVNAARRGERTSELVSLMGVNASATVAGAPQMDAAKFSELIYREMVKLNRNIEKPFARQ